MFHPGEVNEVTALKQVTLIVDEGGFLVVLGGNGSGKIYAAQSCLQGCSSRTRGQSM